MACEAELGGDRVSCGWVRDSLRGQEADKEQRDDAHRKTEAEARTGNSHKEMKIKGGTTGRRKPAPTHRPSERWV